jgi:plastocyanin
MSFRATDRVNARAAVALVVVLLLGADVRADATGRITGTVELVAMEPAPVGADYAGRTRRPIEPADPARAIVYLERDDGVYPDRGDAPVVVIAQEGYQFRPAVAAVRRGAAVSFPNRDDEFHNVFSYSSAKRFDLGRYRKDEESPPIVFDQTGLVKIYCEIHEHMRSLLLVLDTPWFTSTDERGRFVLADIPPGEYRLRAFLPSEETLEVRVAVAPGTTRDLALRR